MSTPKEPVQTHEREQSQAKPRLVVFKDGEAEHTESASVIDQKGVQVDLESGLINEHRHKYFADPMGPIGGASGIRVTGTFENGNEVSLFLTHEGALVVEQSESASIATETVIERSWQDGVTVTPITIGEVWESPYGIFASVKSVMSEYKANIDRDEGYLIDEVRDEESPFVMMHDRLDFVEDEDYQ
jgi:hypothetical protein